MLEVNVNIVGLDQLTEVLSYLASALAHANGMKNTVVALNQMKTESSAQELAQEVAAQVKQATVQAPLTAPTQAQAPVTAPAPAPAPAPVTAQAQAPTQAPAPAPTQVPVGSPAYTFEQLQLAAANFARASADNRNSLIGLLQKLGLGTFTDLGEDKFDAFAAGLRELGGVI